MTVREGRPDDHTDPGTPSQPPLVDLDDPTVCDLAHICAAALQLSGFASEKDERESLARQRVTPGHAER